MPALTPVVALPSHHSNPSVASTSAASPFSLATAVPAQVMSRRLLRSAMSTLSNQMRSNIIQGKDINLASLLLPSPASNRQMVECGDVSMFLKSSDPRLQRNLTFGEFAIAFGIYRDVLCQAYPDHRKEFDLYLSMMADFNQRYGGTLFYEYHKSFAANLNCLIHCPV